MRAKREWLKMTTRKELETIKNRVLKALNSESVKRHRIQIKTTEDSDSVFSISDVQISAEDCFLNITDKAFTIHLMISYEDIKEISDRTTSKVLYMKVNWMKCPKCKIDVKSSPQYFYRCYNCHTVSYVTNEGTLKEYKLDKRVIKKCNL